MGDTSKKVQAGLSSARATQPELVQSTVAILARSGEGMDEETLARCHEPFFSRFDPPSLGMGLEIARLVVEAHKGRLEIESDETGTTATLVLPGACADMELP